ncbi:MAG: hydantoinase B/oxoprolinase family protein, partial [Pseudomonadota bacterium]
MSIKDLTDKEFLEKYGCDRFTATVLSARYRNITQRMCKGLLHTAFSIILRDWYDFAATISGPPELDYPLPAMSDSLLVFLGTMPEGVPNTIEEFGVGDIQPGDVLVRNDPYRNGTHVNDTLFVRPVFYNGKIVAFASLMAHMLDMGGTVPAGFSGSKGNIFENGLVIPPMLIFRGEKPVKPTWKLLADNTRYFAVLIPDIMAIYQNLLMGERELLDVIGKYGLEALWGAMRYACDRSEEAMRNGISRMTDGDYEAVDLIDADGVDDSEEYQVRVKVKIRGDRAEVDLSGTSRQARTCINAGWLDAKTAVLVAMKVALDPFTPITSASMKPIDVVLPEGTFVSAMPPEGAIFLYWESSNCLLLAILKALAPALGRNAISGDYGSLNIHNAMGLWPDGRPWVTMAQVGG